MYTKKYFEEYARLTLEKLLPYPVDNYYCKDQPDIQNDINSIGIEVTRTNKKTELEKYQYGERFLRKKPTEEEIKRFAGEFYINKDGYVYGFSSTKGLITPSLFEDIESSVNKKKEKIINYKKFDKNGLYCFNEFRVDDSDIIKIAKINIAPFDFLIVNSVDIVYYVENHEYYFIELSEDELQRIKSNALAYSLSL